MPQFNVLRSKIYQFYIYSPSTVYRDQVTDEPEKFEFGKVHKLCDAAACTSHIALSVSLICV